MTIAAAIVRSNNNLTVLEFVNEGVGFRVLAKSSASTGRVTIYIKAEGEKKQIIGYYDESRSMEELVEYVKEELLEEGVC